MERISKPFQDAGERYGIIVVGSGYGGGVAASRLARAGQQVCVLERGREILPGKYPKNPKELLAETQVSSDTGRIGETTALLDLRVGSDMAVLVGCGLGGTSLINASVALEADPRVLQDDGWPAALREGPHALEQRYYDLARAMLGSTPYPRDFPELHKLAALEASAKGLGKPFFRPPINVTFKAGPNAAGVQQAACTLCGDCVTGCNYGAKNTTLMNYLPDAANHGAQIFTGAKVLWVERAGDRWKVIVEDPVDGAPASGRQALVREVLAETVILAAGTLGSTEILLRSREKGLTTSRTLGLGFSGNGDTLGFAYNCAIEDDNPERSPIYGIGAGHLWPKKPETEALRPGPCITGIIDMRDASNARDGLVIEDGVLPSGLALTYPPMFLFASALSAGQPRYVDEAARLKDAQILAEGVQKGMEDSAPHTYAGPVSRTQTFLVMSHEDKSDGGNLLLEDDRLKITFAGVGEQAVFARNDRILQKASEAVRGNYVSNPLWSRSADRQLISVHPLGGCRMGETGKTGVVNDRCQVFTGSGSDVHEGLFVCDGSVIRGSLGVNPLLTIAAISERAMELLAGEKDWKIDYSPPSVPKSSAAVLARSPARTIPAPQALAARRDWPEIRRPADAKSFWSRIGKALAALGPLIAAIFARNWGRAFDIFNENFCDISPGMQFSERMHGPFSIKVQRDEEEGKHRISNPFELAARRAKADGDLMEAKFDVGVASLHELINRPDHAAALCGTINFTTLAADPMPISEGRVELLVDDPTHIETWLMIYSGLVESGRRGTLHFEGRKTLRGRAGSHWWTDVTTLFVTMRDTSEEKNVVGRGILRLGLQDFVGQAQATQVSYTAFAPSAERDRSCQGTILRWLEMLRPGARSALELLSASKLASFFAERIIRAHGGILPYLQNYPAMVNAERKGHVAASHPLDRIAPAPKPTRHQIRTADGEALSLTRYQRGHKGPLIVAPGIGVTAASYAMDTVDVNFVEYFCRAGYDVWLFDYRASPALPSSKRSFTIDDIVKNDWPAAVEAVRRITGAKDVQILGHCVGSLSLLMALLNDLKGVRSAICSQFSLHPVTHWFNYAKIDLDVVSLVEGGLARYLGTNLPLRRDAVDGITKALGKLLPEGRLPKNLVEGFPYVDMRSSGTADDQALDALLWGMPMPPEDHCKNPVCHRMFAVYGLALNHAHLNEATHNALEDIFGPISSHLFNQLKLIMDLGRAVDKDGKDRYLAHPEHLTMPITLLSGSRNRILMPESTQRTLEWMRDANPNNASMYSRHVFPQYAHMDLFIGKNADRDIFPFIEKTLDAHNA